LNENFGKFLRVDCSR